jgi:uncharacterized protein YjbI with pentapeptide repeats
MGDNIIEDVDLSGANLSEAVLQGTTIRGSCMKEVNFENAILAEMGISDSWLNKANFKGAELCEASFDRCNFSGAVIDTNQLRGCYLTQTLLPDGDIVTNIIQD